MKTGSLSAGTHVIVLEAEDDAGNRSRKSVTVTAGTRTNSKFTDISTSWAAGYINLLADRGIMSGEQLADGTMRFHPNNNLRRSEFAVLTDISTSWAAGYINLLADRGIMSGEQLADGTMRFHPNNNLRRSEFAVLMAKVLELDTSSVGNLPFDDAASLPQWAKASIAAVTKAGVMSGQSNPNTGAVNFNPNAEITRAEVMSVISRCLPRGYVTKSEKFTDASSIPAWANTGAVNFNPNAEITRAEVMSVISRCLPRGYVTKSEKFTDASSIPAWAKSAVSDVTSAGIINGYTDGTIKPNAKITRAEIASVICNFK